MATGLSAIFLADDEIGLAERLPAAWLEVFPEVFFRTFFNGFFLATGFAARLDGDFFGERLDLADAGFFLAGFFVTDLAFDGLPERRFGACDFARDLGVGRLRAGFERGFALRLAFALDLARDFFTDFEAFLAMVVLLLRRDSRRAHRCFWILPRLGRLWKTSNYNMRLTGASSRATAELVAGQLQLTRTFGLFHGEIRSRPTARFGVIAAFSCIQPIPVHSFDKLGFQ
jgi:hypothetical protein